MTASPRRLTRSPGSLTSAMHLSDVDYNFWVLRDPWTNQFCVLQPEFPELAAALRGP